MRGEEPVLGGHEDEHSPAQGQVRRGNPLRVALVHGRAIKENKAMDGWAVTALGFVAGLLSTSSFVPQLIKAWKESDLHGISRRMYAVNLCSFALWTTYGALIGSLPVIVFN